jgi:hypothetical protein
MPPIHAIPDAAALALAYIDPGAGSLLLQLLIGGVGGTVLAVRLFWRRIAAKWNGRKDARPQGR